MDCYRRARSLAGFTDSVLARLVHRNESNESREASTGFRTFPPGPFSQYREALLWAKANRGPGLSLSRTPRPLPFMGFLMPIRVDSSHCSRSARLRRRKPKSVIVHYDDLADEDITFTKAFRSPPSVRLSRTFFMSGDRIDLLRRPSPTPAAKDSSLTPRLPSFGEKSRPLEIVARFEEKLEPKTA